MDNPELYKLYMREALKEAENAFEANEVPVGAVIVYDDKIIARASNQMERLRDPTAHAEILAIKQAASYVGNWRLEGCSVFTTLQPCVMCLGAILLARISVLVYGCRSEVYIYEGMPEAVNHISKNRLKIVENVLEDECQRLLKDFFKKVRRQK